MAYDQFHAPNVYHAELGRHANQWLGHPLWFPAPETSGEVQIGDVGYVSGGRFLRLFNAASEEGLDIDKRPEGFERLVVNRRQEDERDPLLEPGPLASASVKLTEVESAVEASVAGANVSLACSFQCSSHQGAILHLKNHARGLCVVPNKSFPNYMKKHHRSWVDFAQNDLELEISPEDIILVRGWVKTSEWAVAAFKSDSRSYGGSISASFSAVPSAGFEFRVSKKDSMMCASNSGPKPTQSSSTPSSSTSALSTLPQNQCIFLQYYKIKYRRFWLPSKIQAAAGPSQLPPAPPEDQSPGVPASEAMDIGTEVNEPHDPPLAPLDTLLEYILEYSDAEVAIASEGDLQELFSKDDIPTDIHNYLRIHRPNIAVDEDHVGMLSIESLILGKQRRRRTQAQQGLNNDELDSLRQNGAPNAQGNAERVVLANGRTLQWLDLVLKDPEAEGVSINSFSISRNNERILTCSDNNVIKLWDLRTGEDLHDFIGHDDSVLSVAFSPDGTKFVSGSADNTAIIWDVEGAQAICTLREHKAWVWCVAYAPDSATIATGSFDQTVCLWEPTGQQRFTLAEHEGQVTLLAFSPDGGAVLAGADTVAYLWDCATGRPRTTLRGHTATIQALAFTRAGDRIATGADDGTARIWDAHTGDELVTLREHTGPVWAVDFAPDGLSITTGSYDATIAVCDSFSGAIRFVTHDRPERVHSLAYSYDGKYVVSGDAAGLVKLWDAESGAFVAEFQGHQDKVKAVAWTPDDKAVVSSSEDGCVRVWSVQDVLRIL